MELTVYERLMLLQIVPVAHQRGSFVRQRALGDYLSDLGFPDEEIEELELTTHPDGRITWDEEAAMVREINLSPVRREMTMESMKKLDDEGAITPSLMPVFDKFEYEAWLADQEGDDE